MRGFEELVGRLVLAPALVVGVALLVTGETGTGGGFAGGVLAALALIFRQVTVDPGRRTGLPLRALMAASIAGGAVAFGVAFAPVLAGEPILEHVPGPGAEVPHWGSLAFSTVLAFEAGIFCVVLGAVAAVLVILGRRGEAATRSHEEER